MGEQREPMTREKAIVFARTEIVGLCDRAAAAREDGLPLAAERNGDRAEALQFLLDENAQQRQALRTLWNCACNNAPVPPEIVAMINALLGEPVEEPSMEPQETDRLATFALPSPDGGLLLFDPDELDGGGRPKCCLCHRGVPENRFSYHRNAQGEVDGLQCYPTCALKPQEVKEPNG